MQYPGYANGRTEAAALNNGLNFSFAYVGTKHARSLLDDAVRKGQGRLFCESGVARVSSTKQNPIASRLTHSRTHGNSGLRKSRQTPLTRTRNRLRCKRFGPSVFARSYFLPLTRSHQQNTLAIRTLARTAWAQQETSSRIYFR